MAKKLAFVEVKGKHNSYHFETYVDPKYLYEWREDGLEIYLIENTIPDWLPSWMPARWWCFAQDVFNFNNPFR